MLGDYSSSFKFGICVLKRGLVWSPDCKTAVKDFTFLAVFWETDFKAKVLFHRLSV